MARSPEPTALKGRLVIKRSEPATAVISRTDPNEHTSVVMLPELDAIHS